MSSLFQLNPKETPLPKEEINAAIENRDREIYALRQQLQTLKNHHKNLKIQLESPNSIPNNTHNEYSRQRIEKLMAALAERERQMRLLQQEAKKQFVVVNEEWQKECLAKEQALNEITALHGQLDYLKSKVIQNKMTLKTQQDQIQSLHHENALAASQLQLAAVTSIDKEILEAEYEKLKTYVKQSDEKLEVALKINHDLESRFNDKKALIEDYVRQIECLTSSLAEADLQVKSLLLEKKSLQVTVSKTQNRLEDSEARLKVAHYHLAKKVKESTYLADKNQELKGQINELLEDVQNAQTLQKNLQNYIEERSTEEKRKHDSIQDALRDTESLVGAWERKYFEIYEKFQEADQQLKGFETLQDKLNHMKSLWIGFGDFFGDSTATMRETSIKEKSFTSHFTSMEKLSSSNDLGDIRQTPHPTSL